ncbi:preprotein translocase subunit SecY [Clostridia bacterium]|nr:preprotein translocase subunit SecY [Clostridia bacterium]
MFQTLKMAWKSPELRKKLLFTLWIIVVFRIGSVITVPFIDPDMVKTWMDSNASNGNFLEYLNIISGGSLSKASIFALSITPYINASIIIQLLVFAIPPLERLQHEGDEGRKRIGQITTVLTMALAAFMSFAYYVTLKNANAVSFTEGGNGVFVAFVICGCFVAGSSLIVWLGGLVTKKGVGNGISIILFAGIVARYPSDIGVLWSEFLANKSRYIVIMPIVAIVFIGMITIIVLMNSAERRIPINYAKRVVGRKQFGGQSTFMPIKVLMSGVMPIIFAMSFMSLPSTIQLWKGVPTSTHGFYYWFCRAFSMQSWSYAVMYMILIVLFNYFYVSMQYNPVEIANQLRQNNGAIPGIRPGQPTAHYIQRILSKITFVGALFLGFIAIFPIFFSRIEGLETLTMGGTSMLIVVNVALDTVRQLESQLIMRTHKGFL